jgi:hypothetical protein
MPRPVLATKNKYFDVYIMSALFPKYIVVLVSFWNISKKNINAIFGRNGGGPGVDSASNRNEYQGS